MSWKDNFPKENRFFEIDNGILYNGDAVEILQQFPKNSIDLIITSPPYDNLRFYGNECIEELEKIWNFEKFKLLAKEIYKRIKQGGIVVWVVNDATINGSETGNSFRQALYFKEQCNFKLHDTMIYNKNILPFPEINRYSQCFEYMFVFSKGKPKTVNLIKDKLNKFAYKKIKSTTNRMPNGLLVKTSAEKNNINRKIKQFGIRYNIWNISSGYNKSTTDKIAFEHPAIFPEQLAHDHIISWSKEKDIILDPLCGSGTTLKMAEILNRKWIGIEINEKYCDISRKRILSVVNKIF